MSCLMRHLSRRSSTISSLAMSIFPDKCISMDRFRGVLVDLTRQEASGLEFDAEKFPQQVKDAETSFAKEKRIRAIWFKIPLNFSHLIPPLVAQKYDYHHAKPGFVQMVKWVAHNEKNNIPSFPYTNVGVGALVVDMNNNVLVVQEKFSPVGRMWKFPGGFADQGEEFSQTAERECLEETGVRAHFKAVLGIRHMHRFQFGCSDLYIMCLLVPDESGKTIKKCEQEILDATWMPMEQAKEEVSTFNRQILQLYENYLKFGFGIHREMVDFVLGGKISLYSVSNPLNAAL